MEPSFYEAGQMVEAGPGERQVQEYQHFVVSKQSCFVSTSDLANNKRAGVISRLLHLGPYDDLRCRNVVYDKLGRIRLFEDWDVLSFNFLMSFIAASDDFDYALALRADTLTIEQWNIVVNSAQQLAVIIPFNLRGYLASVAPRTRKEDKRQE
jgi:hypothetical protein